MYYRLSGHIVDTAISYLRRVFRYNREWVNTDLEIVQLPSGSIELAFEQFFEENEKYPIITVAAAGGTLDPIAFNDFIEAADDDSVNFGRRMQSSVTVDASHALAVQVPVAAYTETIRALKVTLASVDYSTGGDDLDVCLYRNYTTTPVLVASGSLPGNTAGTFDELYAEFHPQVALTGADYWVTLQSPSGSSYYVGIDTSATTMYNFTGSGYATGSINGALVLPAFVRFGTNFEGSIQIRCMSKNSTKEAYKLSELVAQYLTMAKHAQLSRGTTATDGLLQYMIDADAIAEFANKDISIRGIRLGTMENRRRGDNDVIFTVTVVVDTYSEWHEDFLALPLKDITTDIQSFS